MFRKALALATLATAFGPALLGCSCVAMGVKYDLSISAVVFRGTVTEVRQLPLRKEMGERSRYTATFSVSRYWKGHPGESVILHVIEPRPDCVGARFTVGAEYVVFALAQKARDYRLGDDFWYGWLDIFRKGEDILTVDNFCDSPTEIRTAAAILRELGKGKRVK
ncbi:MAG: hypothetical protein JST11_09820 [Acidobacteria bacterium]|nr:hypothetical protein [Acidobacteriota bacterium]